MTIGKGPMWLEPGRTIVDESRSKGQPKPERLAMLSGDEGCGELSKPFDSTDPCIKVTDEQWEKYLEIREASNYTWRKSRNTCAKYY